jgi:hypothetical protein
MNRLKQISGTFFGVALAVFMIVPVSFFGISTAVGEKTKVVYCEINDVKLYAHNAEECVKAGGKVVTEEIDMVVLPEKAVDNPEEQPKIQRTKDKKPKAP